jgi:PleD family two-component response regulator
LNDEILRVLGGKRFALIGFTPDDAENLTLCLEESQAFCRNLNAQAVQPGSAALGAYDLILLYVSEELAQSPWMDSHRLAALGKPLLMIGWADFLGQHMSLAQECAADFMTATQNPAEVILRSYHILLKAAATVEQPTPASSERHVVIADDDATTIALVKAVLQRDGIQCHIANDGGKALQLISDIVPQAAILDVNMPHLDGFEVLAAVRNQAHTQSIPLVLLTSRQQETDIIRGFGLGADDYIVKPFSPMELMARLRRLLRSGHAAN